MKRIIIIADTLLFLLLGTSGHSQYLTDPRSLGMAGSNIAITEGNEYLGGNPATLAVKRSFNFELQLLSARLAIQNNSYSLQEYDRYFTTGDTLSPSEIDRMLGYIPDDGLRADMQFGVKSFGFFAPPFSLSLSGMGNVFAELPKDALRFPFYGNRDIKEYSLRGLEGEGWGAAAVNLGIGIPFTSLMENTFDFFALGVTAKYIKGMQYAEIQAADGYFVTTPEVLSANAFIETLRSSSGGGFGIDLGLLAEWDQRWTISAGFTNLMGSMRWGNAEIRRYEFRMDSVSINQADSLGTVERDTSFAVGDFATRLPLAANVAVAYQMSPKLVLSGAWRQGLNRSMGNNTTPLISAGTEYKPIPLLPLRMGMAVGGANGFALGLGFGIDLNFWQLNLGYLNHNFRWFRSSRSIELAISTHFRF
ncbi:MAG: DUF5723 family protein [Calditrichia bacterium]